MGNVKAVFLSDGSQTVMRSRPLQRVSHKLRIRLPLGMFILPNDLQVHHLDVSFLFLLLLVGHVAAVVHFIPGVVSGVCNLVCVVLHGGVSMVVGRAWSCCCEQKLLAELLP